MKELIVKKCDSCNKTVEVIWDANNDGYYFRCPHCGNLVEFLHDDGEYDIYSLFKVILSKLQRTPTTNGRLWTDGEMILSTNESYINHIADLMEEIRIDVVTGYYDPETDAVNGEINEYTGFYYVTIK